MHKETHGLLYVEDKTYPIHINTIKQYAKRNITLTEEDEANYKKEIVEIFMRSKNLNSLTAKVALFADYGFSGDITEVTISHERGL